MMSIKRFKPKPKPCLLSVGKGNLKRSIETPSKGNEFSNNVDDKNQISPCEIKSEVGSSAPTSKRNKSNNNTGVLCIQNIEWQQETRVHDTEDELEGNNVKIVTLKPANPQSVLLCNQSKVVFDSNEIQSNDLVDESKNGDLSIVSKPSVSSTEVTGIEQLSLPSSKELCIKKYDLQVDFPARVIPLPQLKNVCDSNAIFSEGNVQNLPCLAECSSSANLYSLPKPEDIDCEFHMEDDIKVSISKPRLHQPMKLPGSVDDGNTTNIIKVHLNYLPSAWSKPKTDEQLIDCSGRKKIKQVESPLPSLKNSTKKFPVNKNVEEIKAHLPGPSLKESDSMTKAGEYLRSSSKVSVKKSVPLIHKYKKQTPVVAKLGRLHSKPMSSSKQQHSNVQTETLIKNSVISVEFDVVNIEESNDNNKLVLLSEIPEHKVPSNISSILKSKALSSSLHKSLVPKPIPKVIETRKQSCEGVKETESDPLQNPRSKCITSSYGKTCYEMKQKYLNKYGGETPNLDKLTMLDLIFFNPKTNPMPKEQDEKIISLPKMQKFKIDSDLDKTLEEELIDDVTPVPQLKVDQDGNIIIDPSTTSLSGEETENLKMVPEKQRSSNPSLNSTKLKQSWSHEDTVKFYKALHAIGADFSSMSELFPERSRKNLKSKFKREEKKNGALIDKVLTNPGNFNVGALAEELALSSSTSSGKPKKLKPTLKEGEKLVSGTVSNDNKPEEQQKNSGLRIIGNKHNGGQRKIKKNIVLEMSEMEDSTLENSTNNKGAHFEFPQKIIDDDMSLLKATTKLLNNFDLIHEKKNFSVNNKKGAKRIASKCTDYDMDKLSKKAKQRRLKDRSRNPGGIRNLQTIIADEESLTVDSFDMSSPVKENQIMINTNIHYDSMSITKSISYGMENFGSPIDVNITIEHKPVEICVENIDKKKEVYLRTENDIEISNYAESTGLKVSVSSKDDSNQLPIQNRVDKDQNFAS